MCSKSHTFFIGAFCDEDIPGHSLTIANVEELLNKTLGDLRTRGVQVVAASADNAANFQGVTLCLVRCLAHGIQLLVHEVLPMFEEQIAFATSMLQELALPDPVPTRWNSVFRMLKCLSGKRTQVKDKEKVVANDIAVELLAPFAVATDIVQKDGATTFDSLVALQHILSAASFSSSFGGVLRSAILKRKQQLFSDVLVVVCFLSPTTKRHTLGEHVHDIVYRKICDWRYISVPVHGNETVGDCIDLELQRFAVRPPLPMQAENFTRNDFLKWWCGLATGFPRLATIATALLDVTPTEASVERIFSKMKFSVGKSRTKMEARHVMNARDIYAMMLPISFLDLIFPELRRLFFIHFFQSFFDNLSPLF